MPIRYSLLNSGSILSSGQNDISRKAGASTHTVPKLESGNEPSPPMVLSVDVSSRDHNKISIQSTEAFKHETGVHFRRYAANPAITQSRGTFLS